MIFSDLDEYSDSYNRKEIEKLRKLIEKAYRNGHFEGFKSGMNAADHLPIVPVNETWEQFQKQVGIK